MAHDPPGAGKVAAVAKNVAYITSRAPSDDPTQHNELQARDVRDGALLWRTQIAGTGDLEAVVADETIYLTSFDSQRYYYNEHRWTALYALNVADGIIRWQRTLDASAGILAITTGQMYAQEGLTDVVCSSHASALDARDGTKQWDFPGNTQDGRGCTSFVGAENNVAYGMTTHENSPTVQSSLYALNAVDGSARWRINLPISAHDATLANGAIYLSSDDALAAYRVGDGSRLWRVRGEGGRVFLFNGGLYVSMWGRSVDALDPASGALLWRYQTTATMRLAAVANGMLFGVGSYIVTDSVWHQEIVALDANSGKPRWRYQIGSSVDSPLIG